MAGKQTEKIKQSWTGTKDQLSAEGKPHPIWIGGMPAGWLRLRWDPAFCSSRQFRPRAGAVLALCFVGLPAGARVAAVSDAAEDRR
jgi:hypothetical protein